MLDYGDKAEDAVDYEDIDEEYDGPETQIANEEENLLPKKDFFSVEASFEVLKSRSSVFDDEDYDEESEKEQELANDTAEVNNTSSTGICFCRTLICYWLFMI